MHVTSQPVFAPDNYKKGKLINGTYRIIDFIYLMVGIGISVVLFFVVMFMFVPTIPLIISVFLPALIAYFLTSRHAYYHNNFELLKIIIKFQFSTKEYFNYVRERNDLNE